ncbi:alpha-ketoacid dehydrogenase kinase [Heliocybe sulcata]|uniref:Protein-serine/threonine kinase n=1 Tax=Heliocybe sulcata TaxID=5364 RepID=A0A5C3NB41_9AGAM|nr:alpha-ketoacid dehydrogenase kinase [Heliocybe sulcata]
MRRSMRIYHRVGVENVEGTRRWLKDADPVHSHAATSVTPQFAGTGHLPPAMSLGRGTFEVFRMSSVLSRPCKLGKVSARQRRSFALHRRPPEPVPSGLTDLLEKHSQRPPTPLTLSTLLSLGRPPTPESVLTSVSYVQAEIPRRLAQRVKSLQALPFIVGTNPYVARVLEAHRNSFLWLATQPPVRTLEENGEFISQLETLVQSHANDIPTLARG